MQLSTENHRWLDDFYQVHGRAPCILHIGNIANNAYNNAKLMNEAGVDSDVICYDYYHIMGCPEWEDADYIGEIKDDFQPDWTKVDLRGFVRPRWFAQGSLPKCIDYLLARRSRGFRSKNEKFNGWLEMKIENLSEPVRLTHPFGRKIQQKLFRMRRGAARAFSRRRRLIKSKSPKMLRSAARAFMEPTQDVVRKIEQSVRRLGNDPISKIISEIILLFVFTARIIIQSFIFSLRIIIQSFIFSLRIIIQSLLFIFCFKFLRKPEKPEHEGSDSFISSELIYKYKHEFSDRDDKLLLGDFKINQKILTRWRQLLWRYDYVIGYSTDPIIPLVCDVPFFAFEHGTIREIPYHKTAQGRLTSLAYRMAQHVFVTNFDCVTSAEYLAPGRFTVINHPYDEDHGLTVIGGEQARKNLLDELDCDFLFFHPTRQDWVDGTGYADKNNDVFLRAFISLRNRGAKVGLVCCSWGSNVVESKALLDKYSCSAYVRWVAPLAITPFERMCLASDIVVDQFKLGAFGGVVFKAMAVGTPILTYLDANRLQKQYPVCPPVVNCRTSDEIVERMKPIIASPKQLADIGGASRAWMKKYHAKETTVNAILDQFRHYPPFSPPLATTE